MEKPTRKQIEEFIENEINPSLAMHGGFLELTDYDKETDIVHVKMGGGCHGCSSSRITLRNGVEQYLRDEFPNLGEIEDVTDHSLGENPYY